LVDARFRFRLISSTLLDYLEMASLGPGHYVVVVLYVGGSKASDISSFYSVSVEGGGFSWAVTRLHTMIDLTGHRTRDLPRIRRALYRLTEKA
jgi:hypothetical protein